MPQDHSFDIVAKVDLTEVDNAYQQALKEIGNRWVKGFTVFYWATGTWWIPMLLVLAIWRHVVRRFPFTYDPMYWGAVFPLGMYAVSTLRMMEALSLPFLGKLPHLMFALGITAWTLLFIGQLRALRRHWSSSGAQTQ